ncbi:unnamed protein product (mitochondrion) [Plasmodiophora brassicae]|uniref:Oxidation resistance protein 1 n=1 Tax=Plasmodiophora brassicae TaxID=37360 RepID=A0A3P3YD21_PLABS|nr:unnamed protein product [Plasmodiophora brassicae]
MDGGDDDEPSIQDRLWRTLRFDWSLWSPVTSPTAPTTSSTVAPVPSRSDNDDPDRPQLDRQWVVHHDQHRALLQRLAAQTNALRAVERALRQADRRLLEAQQAESAALGSLTQVRSSLSSSSSSSSQISNVQRLIDSRRRRLQACDAQRSSIGNRIGQQTSMLYRLEAGGAAADSEVAVCRSELVDLQRQMEAAQAESGQHRQALEALRAQLDAFALERARHQSAQAADRGRLDDVQRRYDLCHGESVSAKSDLDRLMVAQLHGLVRLDRLRDAVSSSGDVLAGLLAAHNASRATTTTAARRASEPADTAERVDRYVARVHWLGAGASCLRGSLTLTSFLVLFESDAGRRHHLCLDLPDIVQCTMDVGMAGVQVHTRPHRVNRFVGHDQLDTVDWGNPVRFRADESVARQVHRFLSARLARYHKEAQFAAECQQTGIDVDRDAPVRTLSDVVIRVTGDSHIVTRAELVDLIRRVPVRHHFDEWRRLYTLTEDGMSLSAMYRAVQNAPVAVLVIQDNGRKRFGAFVSDRIHVRPSYFGTGEAFVFQYVPRSTSSDPPSRTPASSPVSARASSSESVAVYQWSGKNKFFALCRPDSMAVGGGSHFAIYLTSALRHGSSGASDTFDCPMLSAAPDFLVAQLEVWAYTCASIDLHTHTYN